MIKNMKQFPGGAVTFDGAVVKAAIRGAIQEEAVLRWALSQHFGGRIAVFFSDNKMVFISSIILNLCRVKIVELRQPNIPICEYTKKIMYCGKVIAWITRINDKPSN